MNAPDRSEWVKDIWNSHPPTTLINDKGVMKFPDDDTRREYLLRTLLPKLKKRELQGEWGCLIKTEQNNKIPVDIAVWKETMEHIDVLTDTGPAWINHGPARKGWIFGAILPEIDVVPVPIPPPIPVPPEMVKLIEMDVKLNEVLANTKFIIAKLEHYDEEFRKIQPDLLKLLNGGLLSGLFGRRDIEKE